MMGGPDGGGKLITTTEKWFSSSKRWVAYVLSALFAGPIVCILAGATKFRARTFFVLDFVGTIAIVLMLRLFAKPLQPLVDQVVEFNGKYVKWITAVAIIGVVFSLTLGSKKDGLSKATSLGKD